MSVMTNGQICCFSSCAEDIGIKAEQGWRELTAEEIAAAGMIGHEHMVAPDNATVTDGRINFVQPPDSTGHLFTALRSERDARLAATDKYMLADYPISADNLVAVKTYRMALRNLPDQDGAPWDGGGEGTPWPELPKA